MGGVFSTWRRNRLPLADNEAEHAGQRLLERVAADLTVALGAVGIANVKTGARVEYGQIQARADGQRSKVHVAAVLARRPGALQSRRAHADIAHHWIVRSDRHDAHERIHGYLDRIGKERHVATVHCARPNQVTRAFGNIERRVAFFGPRVVFAKDAAGRARAVHAVRHARPKCEDLHLESVAGLRSVDIDRTGQHVATTATWLAKRAARRPEVEYILQNLVALPALSHPEFGRRLVLRRSRL